MKDPAFLFYSSDFLTGVTDLTMEERGQYITLLCLQHQKGHLTEKTIRLSVGSISVDVRNKFAIDENGNLYNEILDKKIEERKKFTESRRNNGLKGGRPKKEQKPSDKPLGLPSENLIEDEDIIEIKDRIKVLCNGKFEKVFETFEKWRDYLVKQHDKVLFENKYTYETLEKKIREMGAKAYIEAVDYSIENNYKQVYKPKEQKEDYIPPYQKRIL
jgi:hypothetical protein